MGQKNKYCSCEFSFDGVVDVWFSFAVSNEIKETLKNFVTPKGLLFCFCPHQEKKNNQSFNHWISHFKQP